LPDLYIINIQPDHWETCRKESIYGMKRGAPTPFAQGRWKTGDICLVRVSGRNYGVRAIWCVESEKPVKSREEVPWTDADYEWLIQLRPLVELAEPFSEEFEGKSKYSEKVQINSIRIVQSVVKLTPTEIENYLEPLMKEKTAELAIEAKYLDSKTRVDLLLATVLREATGAQPSAVEKKKYELEDIVGEPINFRGIVYAPLNEAGVILLFSRVMSDLGLFYEASLPTDFPDMVGRVRTVRGLEKRYIEFEYKSSNFKSHGHLEKMKQGTRCDMIVCWEHDWPDCPIEVIELKSLIPMISLEKSADETTE